MFAGETPDPSVTYIPKRNIDIEVNLGNLLAGSPTTQGSCLPSIVSIVMKRDIIIPESHKLKGESNYGAWSFLMENILRSEDQWECCIEPPPATMTVDQQKLCRSAHTMLNLSCHLDLMQHLRGYTSSHACWTGLQAKYASKDPARRLALWRNLANLKMADNTTMDAHICDFKGLTQRLSDIGISLSVDI